MRSPDKKPPPYISKEAAPYNAPKAGGLLRGLTVLLIILVLLLLGGLIIYNSLSTPPAGSPPAADAEATESTSKAPRPKPESRAFPHV